MMGRKLGPLPSVILLQNMAYNMSLNDSTSTMVTTGVPLMPEFDIHHTTEEEISANQVRNQSLWNHDEAFKLNLPGQPIADVETRKDGMSLHNSIKIATWNVRSVKSIGKLSAVCRMFYSSATHGKYGLGEQNGQGLRLLEFCTIHNLIFTDMLVQHHPRRLYTWFHQTTVLRTKLIIVL